MSRPAPRPSRIVATCAVLATSLLASAPVARAELPPSRQRKVADTIRVFGELMSMRDSEIPRDMLEEARCIAVLPDVKKGALGLGGRYGKGLVSCRLPDGSWGPPAFLEVGGVSLGLQVGGELIDLMLVVRNDTGMDYLLRDKFTLGADASVAAGPYGRTAAAATDLQLKAAILSYSRSRGAFVGASVDGAVVRQDRSDNRALYGRPVEARAILLPAKGEELAVPAAVKGFVDALDARAPGPRRGEDRPER